ncbi:MAG: hypothetical protein ACRD9Y_00580 [Blastocatellia bacterium]
MKHADAAKKYLEAAVSYDVWGYIYNKPNVDLAAGHLLYGMGWGYDLLYHDLTEAARALPRQAGQARAAAGASLPAETGPDVFVPPEPCLHSDGRTGRGGLRALARDGRRFIRPSRL